MLNPNIEVHLGKFCELRRQSVSLFDSIPHHVCVYMYHENILSFTCSIVKNTLNYLNHFIILPLKLLVIHLLMIVITNLASILKISLVDLNQNLTTILKKLGNISNEIQHQE